MSALRQPYAQLAPELIEHYRAIKKQLDHSSLGMALLELVYLRVSQINGCAYCLKMHSKVLREAGVAQDKLDVLAGWRISAAFSDQEKAALDWAESLTLLAAAGAPDNLYQALAAYFSNQEIVELTMAVANINAFNRIAVGMNQ